MQLKNGCFGLRFFITLPKEYVIGNMRSQVAVPHLRTTLGVKTPLKKFFCTTFKTPIDKPFSVVYNGVIRSKNKGDFYEKKNSISALISTDFGKCYGV